MNAIERFVGNIKRVGISGYFAERLRMFLGLNQYSDNINTIFYFLNKCIRPCDLPPTDDQDLRIMQKCDAVLLQIFDKLCKRYGFKYWLDYGTLLGAVRHKGFIPWDDDMDVCMLRNDYVKLAETIRGDLLEYDLDIEESVGTICTIGISYKHQDTGVWLDVFPYDLYESSKNEFEARTDLKRKLQKNRRKLNRTLKRDQDTLSKIRSEVVSNESPAVTTLCNVGVETNFTFDIHNIEALFPLTEIEFEGTLFSCPNMPSAYLEDIFGAHYMELPHSGVLHHDGGRGPLSTWARRTGTDMKEVYSYLKNVLECI